MVQNIAQNAGLAGRSVYLLPREETAAVLRVDVSRRQGDQGTTASRSPMNNNILHMYIKSGQSTHPTKIA